MIEFNKNGELKTLENVALNLDAHLSQSETNYINCKDVLDFIPYGKIHDTLTNYTSKISHGGKIVIGGTNINWVAEALSSGAIDAITATQLLYGDGLTANSYKSSCYGPEDLAVWFNNAGFSITKYVISDSKFIIEAYRQ
jgi:hypothetical protein